MGRLDPITRAVRYWDALGDDNRQAERLVQTVPPGQRGAFRRASLTIASVARHEVLAEMLFLHVQNHLLAAAVSWSQPTTNEAIDAWLDRTRALWQQLLAFDEFRKRAAGLVDGRSRPLAAIASVLRETRRLLLSVQEGLAPELEGMGQLDADPELMAILVGTLPEDPRFSW